MLKLAFRSYLAAIHPGNIRLLVKKIDNVLLWLWIYWLIIDPIVSEGTDEVFGYYLMILPGMVPIGLMAWSNLNTKFMISKLMYLTPMSFEDRKEYLNKVLLVKIGVPVLLGVCIGLIENFIYDFSIWSILTTMFLNISFGITMYLCVEAEGRGDKIIQWARKNKKGKYRTAWMNYINAGLIVMLLTVTVSSGFGEQPSGVMLIALGLILLLDIIIIARQYTDTILYLGNYELNFRILGKVKLGGSL